MYVTVIYTSIPLYHSTEVLNTHFQGCDTINCPLSQSPSKR